MKAYRRRGMAPLITFDTRWRRVVKVRLRPLYPREKPPYALNRTLRSGPGKFAEQNIFAPAAIRITDRPVRGLVSILGYPGFLEKV
jgi:hypothetical protein